MLLPLIRGGLLPWHNVSWDLITLITEVVWSRWLTSFHHSNINIKTSYNVIHSTFVSVIVHVDPTASSSKKHIYFGFYSLCCSASLLKHINCNCSAEPTRKRWSRMWVMLAWLDFRKKKKIIMGEMGFRLAKQRKSNCCIPIFFKTCGVVVQHWTCHPYTCNASQTKCYVYFYTRVFLESLHFLSDAKLQSPKSFS